LRPMMRAQLASALAVLDEEQVSLMLETLAADAQGTSPNDAAEPPAASGGPRTATAEDLAYNRAQYEPMIRRAWEAGNAFDSFVTAKLTEHCPPDGSFAVFGSAWR